MSGAVQQKCSVAGEHDAVAARFCVVEEESGERRRHAAMARPRWRFAHHEAVSALVPLPVVREGQQLLECVSYDAVRAMTSQPRWRPWRSPHPAGCSVKVSWHRDRAVRHPATVAIGSVVRVLRESDQRAGTDGSGLTRDTAGHRLDADRSALDEIVEIHC